MALQYADSFQTYVTSQVPRRYTGSNMIIATAGGGPSGSGQYLEGSGGGSQKILVPLTVRSEYYFGFDYKDSLIAGQTIFVIQTAAGATICTFNNNGSINTTFGNSGAGVLVAGTWYQVQIYLKRHASAGIVTVKVDGVAVINLTGLNTGATDIGQCQLGPPGGGSVPQYANLWIFNTLGTHANTWPVGRMKVQALYPNADGTYSAWTPNSGSTHYNRVNQATSDDDTTYNADLTVGDKDSYACTQLPTSGIAHVHGLIVTAIARKDDVNSKTYELFTKSGGTETYSADVQATLNYASSTVDGVAPLLHTDDPNTSAEWTVTNVNLLEIGVKVTL